MFGVQAMENRSIIQIDVTELEIKQLQTLRKLLKSVATSILQMGSTNIDGTYTIGISCYRDLVSMLQEEHLVCEEWNLREKVEILIESYINNTIHE